MGVFLIFAVPTVCIAAVLIAWAICCSRPTYKKDSYERIEYPKAFTNFCSVMEDGLGAAFIVIGALLAIVTIALAIAAGCAAGLKDRKDREFLHDYVTMVELVCIDSNSIKIDDNITLDYLDAKKIEYLDQYCKDNYLIIKSSDNDDSKNITAIYAYFNKIDALNEKILYNRKHHDNPWTNWYNTGNYGDYPTIIFSVL